MTDGIEMTEGVELRIVRRNPANIIPMYANDLIVTHTEKEFFITFSQLEPPPLLTQEEAEGMEDIAAIAVAKIVVSPDFIESVIDVLATNLDKHKERQNAP